MKLWRRPLTLGAAAAALACTGAAAAPAAPTAQLARTSLYYGQSTDLAGGGAAPSRLVALQASPYPFRRFVPIAHTVAAADGLFAFPGLRPDRNTRYRVVGADGALSAQLLAIVSAPAKQILSRLRDGRTQITLLSRHARDLRWGGQVVRWFAAAVGSRHYALLATTHTREVGRGATFANASFFAPLGRFVYRACFNAPGEAAMGPPFAHARCPRHDFVSPHAAK